MVPDKLTLITVILFLIPGCLCLFKTLLRRVHQVVLQIAGVAATAMAKLRDADSLLRHVKEVIFVGTAKDDASACAEEEWQIVVLEKQAGRGFGVVVSVFEVCYGVEG